MLLETASAIVLEMVELGTDDDAVVLLKINWVVMVLTTMKLHEGIVDCHVG